MVADRITVLSRKAGSKDHGGVKWESTGDGSFTVEEIEKKGKGTDVILHLREDEKQYLEEWEIRDVVHRYSDFIEHPIVMEVEKRAAERPRQVEDREAQGGRDAQFAQGPLAAGQVGDHGRGVRPVLQAYLP